MTRRPLIRRLRRGRLAGIVVFAFVVNVLIAWALAMGAGKAMGFEHGAHTNVLLTSATPSPGAWWGDATALRTERRFGLPLLSMRCEVISTVPDGTGAETDRVSGGLDVGSPNGTDPPWFLPLLPEWPGFIGNIVFYALFAWLALTIPAAVRRWWRRWNGCCLGCGQRVHGHAVCSECGIPYAPPHPRSLRWRAGVCAAVGVTANVLMAWTLAVAELAPEPRISGDEADGQTRLMVDQDRRFGVWYARFRIAPAQDSQFQFEHPQQLLRPWKYDTLANRTESRSGLLHAAGWPLPALSDEVTPGRRRRGERFLPPPVEFHGGIETGFLASAWWQTGRVLPLRPMWDGFVTNSVLYAAVAWLLLLGGEYVARRRCMRSSLCPTCGEATGTHGWCAPCATHASEWQRAWSISARRAARLCVLLVVSAAVAFGVAWACASWIHPQPRDATPADDRALREVWFQSNPDRFPKLFQKAFTSKVESAAGLGVDQDSLELQNRSYTFRLDHVRSGWPLRMMRGAHWTSTRRGHPAPEVRDDVWSSDIARWIPFADDAIVPYGIVPVPAIVNTMFYGAAIWVAGIGWRRVRSRARRSVVEAGSAQRREPLG